MLTLNCMDPKVARFHEWRVRWVSLNLRHKTYAGDPRETTCQALRATNTLLESCIQKASNLNDFGSFGHPSIVSKRIGEWFDADLGIWVIVAWGKANLQESGAKPLSRRSLIWSLPQWQLDQVKELPVNPKCIKPWVARRWVKPPLEEEAYGRPLTLSAWLAIALKSPNKQHGLGRLLPREWRWSKKKTFSWDVVGP